MQRVVNLIREFVNWRWSPFYGLIGASLLYVILAILLVPDELGAEEERVRDQSADKDIPFTPPPPEDGPLSAVPRAPHNMPDMPVAAPPTRTLPGQTPVVAKRRGFSPPLPRVEPPPAPPPPVPAAPPPVAPAPQPSVVNVTTTISPAAAERMTLGSVAATRAGRRAAARAARLSAPRLGGVGQPADEDGAQSDGENDSDDADPSANGPSDDGAAVGDGDESGDGAEAAEAEGVDPE